MSQTKANKANSQKKWRSANKAHIASYNAAYNATHKSEIAAYHARPENKAKALKISTAWQKAHPKAHNEIKRAAEKRWRQRNPDRTRAYYVKHQAAKRANAPGWAVDFFMHEAYALARLRTKVLGFKWHVDHMVPLLSKAVCGLHCEQNLRVVPMSVNCAKNNRVWPDMPGDEHQCHRSPTGLRSTGNASFGLDI